MSEQLVLWVVLQLAVAVVVLGSGGQRTPLSPVVVNGGFEDPRPALVGWTLGAIHPAPPYDESRIAKGEPRAELSDQAHGGKHSVHIFWPMSDMDSGASTWILTSEPIAVGPGQVYTVTAWMRGRTGFRCGIVWMSTTDLDRDQAAASLGKDMLIAKSTWQQFRVVVEAPEGFHPSSDPFPGQLPHRSIPG